MDQRPADFYAFGKILWAVLAGRQPPAREHQLESPWRLDELLDDPRYRSLDSLQERLLASQPERLVEWQHVQAELETAEKRFSSERADVRDDEELLAAARRLGDRPQFQTLRAERSATEEGKAWLRDHVVSALDDSAKTAGGPLLSETTRQSHGVLRAYVASEGNPFGDLYNGSERLRSKVPQGFDPYAPTGYDGATSPTGFHVESPLAATRTRAVLALFTSAQKDGIWLLAVPIIARGTERFVPDEVLDSSFATSGPHPWRLEQTVAAAREFSASAFTRFIPMLRRYIEATEAGVDHFDASVWESVPAFRSTSWTAARDLIPPRGHLAAVAMGEVIWILGGQLESGPTDRVDLYSLGAETTRPGPSLTAQRMEFQAVTVDGAIYVMGGTINHQHSATVEMFADQQWTTRTPLRTPRSDFSAVVGADGAIYVIGGLSASGLLQTVERYLPGEDRWEEVAPLRLARRGFAAGADSNHIYVAGGTSGGGGVYTDSLEVLDVAAGTWSDGPALRTSRAWCAGTVAPDGDFFVLGGHRYTESGSGYYVKVTEAFDPVTWEWRRLDPLRVARASFASVASADSVFAIGGDGDGSSVVLIERLFLQGRGDTGENGG